MSNFNLSDPLDFKTITSLFLYGAETPPPLSPRVGAAQLIRVNSLPRSAALPPDSIGPAACA
jgi:hypothetical protein